MLRVVLFLGLSSIGFACGGSDMAVDDLVAEHQTRLEEARTSNRQHNADVGEAPDEGSVRGMERTHEASMNEMMGRMDGTLDKMMSCPMMGATAESDGTMGMRSETSRHAGAMASASSLEVMRTEESTHQTRMGEMLTAMEGRHSQMMSMMGMMCK
ncbi:MAG: hypothetical protein HY791_34265 [Deltaproteobacteria bacterium]|nr:hypothetical protein [Deltaproteobacteria bacterium]